MGKTIKLKKGYNIKLLGEAAKQTVANYRTRTYAVKPTDFVGNAPIPKMMVDVGAEVKAGDALFFNKQTPDVLYCAPVSGEVVEIKRGAKRAITEVVILADSQIEFKEFDRVRISSASRDEIVKHMLSTGCWPLLRQRPYNVVVDQNETPKNIFISGFNTAPLAPDYNYVMEGQAAAFQSGIEVLNKLTEGKVHLSVGPNASSVFTNAKNVEIHKFSGPHPAGNVGVQIHHIAPINKGDIVWTITPQDVLVIGRVFSEGKFDTTRLVALTGSEASKQQYYQTYMGASVAGMLQDNLNNEHVRVIGGDVLTGDVFDKNSHLGCWTQQVTVVEEGDKHEFFGWLLPSYARPSVSRTFPAFLQPNKKYKVNTNTHGEPRAFVVTGLYEDVTPMDLFPMQLIKSILYRDFDQMEGLGIYEVVEEDLALCEFICPSKTDFQAVLRDGLDYMREQA